jgi:hypothetical protein
MYLRMTLIPTEIAKDFMKNTLRSTGIEDSWI